MVFSFANVVSQELPKHPLHGLISNLIGGYGQGIKAHYMPEQIQADIFAKKLGPLATLSANPIFMQNPQFQEALGHLVSSAFKGHGGAEGALGDSLSAPTYSGQANMDADEAEALANRQAGAGTANVHASGWVGQLNKFAPGFGDKVSQFLTGGAVNSKLAKEKNTLDTLFSRMKQYAINSKTLPEKDIDELFETNKNETDADKLARIRKTNPGLYKGYFGRQKSGGTGGTSSNEDQNESDNALLNTASTLAEQIKSRAGVDLSPDVIFGYLQSHPGEIHIEKMIKELRG